MTIIEVAIGLLALALGLLYLHARARHLSLQADVDALMEGMRSRLRRLEADIDSVGARVSDAEASIAAKVAPKKTAKK